VEWVKHFENVSLPVRYYEVLHEPHHYYGWGGSDAERFDSFAECFKAASEAMRKENSQVLIGNDNSMVLSVQKKMLAKGIRVDFLSWHGYLSKDKTESDTSLIYKAENDEGVTYGPEDFIEPARKAYYDAVGKWLPVIQSGGNLNYDYANGTDIRIQQMLNAVTESLRLRMYVLKQSNVTYNIYYNFGGSGLSDSNFGMVNLDDNTPWYPYYANKIIGSNVEVGDQIVESQSSSGDIASLAWVNSNKLNILLICKVRQSKLVDIAGVSGAFEYLKIDDSTKQIQTGTTGVSLRITMNGYTVILLRAV
jgi:hypothetical protein